MERRKRSELGECPGVKEKVRLGGWLIEMAGGTFVFVRSRLQRTIQRKTTTVHNHE
jgi:hypothetical protein